MKWLGLCCNTELDRGVRNNEKLTDLIAELDLNIPEIDLDIEEIWGGPSDILAAYICRHSEFDHVLFVYDGNLWLDSVANQAFYTLVYPSENVVGHHTKPLIDYFLTSEKNEPVKMMAEILYIFYSKFAEPKHKEVIDKLKSFF